MQKRIRGRQELNQPIEKLIMLHACKIRFERLFRSSAFFARIPVSIE